VNITKHVLVPRHVLLDGPHFALSASVGSRLTRSSQTWRRSSCWALELARGQSQMQMQRQEVVVVVEEEEEVEGAQEVQVQPQAQARALCLSSPHAPRCIARRAPLLHWHCGGSHGRHAGFCSEQRNWHAAAYHCRRYHCC
jgi:hypothetical protein